MYEPRVRKDKQRVPILSSKDINIIAERYAEEFSPGITTDPRPFDIDLFSEKYLGLTIDYQYLSNNGLYFGMTVFNDTDKIIIYDSENNCADYIHASAGTIIIDRSLLQRSQEHLYRFTLAHECGHWIFHREYYGYNPKQLRIDVFDTPYTKCREINANYKYNTTKNWDSNKWMEWQADKFAAGLLMPKSSVELVACSNHSKDLESKDAFSMVSKISETFKVSKQAAYIRLNDLKITQNTNSDSDLKQLSYL